jgi:hypothetical protein
MNAQRLLLWSVTAVLAATTELGVDLARAQRGLGFGPPNREERALVTQFDTDGNSRLNDAERARARAWLATQPLATAPSPMASSPTTITYTQLLGLQGSASRSFVASQAGVVSVTLQSAEVPMGIGIGAQPSSGAGCRAATSVVTPAGESPQLATAVDPGSYCLLVFDVSDPGSRTSQVAVTIVVLHP